MTREWQPGDVAMVEDATGEVRVMLRVDQGFSSCWHGAYDGGQLRCLDAEQAGEIRPLVVLDPEDRDQMDRLAETYRAMDSGFAELMDEPWSLPAMRMRQTLREFANPTPPKPDEPAGLGAVVATDSDGDWIRVSVELANPWLNVQTGRQCHWDAVPAVRVLSQGVTP